MLRSQHEIEKLQTEMGAIAQSKRRLREAYDEKRQRILILRGAERQMRLDIAVFSVRSSLISTFNVHFALTAHLGVQPAHADGGAL